MRFFALFGGFKAQIVDVEMLAGGGLAWLRLGLSFCNALKIKALTVLQVEFV